MKLLKTVSILFAISFFCFFSPKISEAQEVFNQNLKLGSISPDVIRLQKFLNAQGFQVATSGPGSVGLETPMYGTLTRNAVALFQKKYEEKILKPQGLKQPTGKFFKATRDVANQIIKDQKNQVTVRPSLTLATTTITYVRPANTQLTTNTTVQTYTVTVTASSSHQQISPNTVQVINEGGTASFTVTPDVGYVNDQVVGGTCQSGSWNGNVYTTGVIQAHCVITFGTAVASYTITASYSGGLSISPYPTSTVNHGSTKAFSVSASTGQILSRQVTGTCSSGSWAHSIFSTGAITGNCTVVFGTATGGSSGSTNFVGSGSVYIKQSNGDFEYSTDNISWISFGWPFSITNSGLSDLTVHFVGDFTITEANQYFVVNSDNIVFQGEDSGLLSPSVFKISGVTNYPGLIQNGTNSVSGYNNIDISNIFVDSDGSTLSTGAGWITQSYFGFGANSNTIANCGSNGAISDGSGGIVGSYAQNIAVSKCFSTGQISMNAGGIVGPFANSVTVTTSYSTGNSGITAGGIFGAYANGAVVTNSYAKGLIGISAGGIIGPYAQSPTISNTYTTGPILGGGIIGMDPANPMISNSYTSGAAGGGGDSGIIQYEPSDGVSNYSETSHGRNGWSPVNAAATLSSVGTVWIEPSPSIPYLLSGFNIVPYASDTFTLSKGSATSPAYSNYSLCVILKINNDNPTNVPGISIDSDTGVVSVANSTANGTYDILLNCNTAQGGYTLPVLHITVTD